MKKTFAALLITLPALALFALPVFAQNPPGGGGTTPPGGGGTTAQPISVKVTLENPFKVGNNLVDVLEALVKNVLMPIAGVVCVLAFIYAGFTYVTAAGDPGKIKTAHRALGYAAVGTAILLGAWAISEAIQGTLNSIIK